MIVTVVSAVHAVGINILRAGAFALSPWISVLFWTLLSMTSLAWVSGRSHDRHHERSTSRKRDEKKDGKDLLSFDKIKVLAHVSDCCALDTRKLNYGK